MKQKTGKLLAERERERQRWRTKRKKRELAILY